MLCRVVISSVLMMILAMADVGLGASVVTSSRTGTFRIEHSSAQLEKITSFPVLIVPGSELDHPGQTNITNRYSCGRYTFSFRMSYPATHLHELILTISTSGGLGPHHRPRCTIDWSDGSTESVDVNAYSENVHHNFSTHGVYPITGSCSDRFAHDTVNCPNRDTSCVTMSELFDEFFKKVSTPMKYQATDQIVIKSLLRLNKACSSSGVVIIWRLTRVVNNTYTEEISVSQPESSVLTLGAETLEPGEYIVFLEVSHPGMGTSYWIDDFMFMYVALPELIPFIDGGHFRYVSHGGVIYINASASFDPISTLPSVTSLPLITTWSIAYYTHTPNHTFFDPFKKDFPFSVSLPTHPVTPILYRITQDNGTLLEVDTTLFGLNTWAVVMFSMTRGDRKSSTIQTLRFVTNAVPVKIRCIFNCNKGRERKFRYDRLELDTVLTDSSSNGSFSYVWRLYIWNTAYRAWFQRGLADATDRSIRIPKTAWVEGDSYRIQVYAYKAYYSTTIVEVHGTVNVRPYGGTCTMSNMTGQAARTWFEFSCTNWKGPDQRLSRSAYADVNPLLTFEAYQHTSGALVEEEPVLLTRSLKSFLILKLGDPYNTYTTTIKVRATDLYNNYNEFDLNVIALPAFAWYNVTPDEAGKAIITSYTNVDYVEDEQELVAMGKVDLIAPLVSSVCSHIHLINLTQWTPPVPRMLNDAGSGIIVDLRAGNNSNVGGFGDVMGEAQVDYDLATLALMEVMQNMTGAIRDSSKSFLANSTEETDTFLGSILTNAFTNIAARRQYLNEETKNDMIYLSELVGIRSLDFKENSTVDESAQIEVVSGEVYNMSQAIVNSVVPDDLSQFVHINNLEDSRTQINEMLSVVGKDIDIHNSSLSPAERAQLYITMQRQLQLELNARKDTAKEAAKMALNLFKNVQDTLRVCSTCTNYGNNFTDQLIVKNTAATVKETDYSTNNSTFRVDGIGEMLGNESVDEFQTASVSAVEFTENVFMYDDDQKSSSVTSNVLHIDVKLSDTRVTPTSMTFNQTVTSPPTTVYTPLINEEDVSGFSLHSYIYRSDTDHTCIIVKPENETGISSYRMYVRLRNVPTIAEYDFVETIRQVDDWKVCIPPESMRGYTGHVFVGIQIPETVRHVNYAFTLVTLGCVAWEEGINKWHSDKCNITWYETDNILGCACRNLTDLTFGNTFFVAANTIDFSTVFLKFSPLDQAAVLGAIGSMLVLYIIALVVVIPLDKKDMLKWGITPLRDNAFGDNHYYIIKVYTGLRKSAGTTSKIAFILSGDQCDTGPRELSDGLRQEISTGSVRSFFMATHLHLGSLLHLYVWSDNSGEGNLASWYLDRVEVFDFATKQTIIFIAEKWLAADTGLDIKIKATTSNETVHFDSRFFYQARDRLSDSHMWVSILYRPQASTFTRAQRASCALVYIFLAMIANAMYFNPADNYENISAVTVGPFRFTLEQMYISIICALITTPVVMLVVFLFKRSRPKEDPFENIQQPKSKCCGCLKRNTRRKYELTYTERLRALLLSSGVPDFKSGFYLSHGYVYVAWVLVVLGILVPAFFIVLYSMEWGKQKSEEWLSTFLLSIIESVLFVDPFMVISISLVLACIVRKPTNELNIDVERIVERYKQRQGNDKDGLDYCFHVLRSLAPDYDRSKREPPTIAPPLQGETLNEAAGEFRHHKRMTSVLMDLVLNFLLIVLLSTICYSNRDDRSFRHQEYIVNQIVDPNYFPSKTVVPRFNKIISRGDFFDWVNQSAFPSLFPEEDMTGQPLHWTAREYMSGFYNYRLGPPRIRQLRTNQDTCSIPRYGTVRCYGMYAIGTEDTTDYCIGWTDKAGSCPTYMTLERVSLDAWSFTSGVELGWPILYENITVEVQYYTALSAAFIGNMYLLLKRERRPALDIWGFPISGHYTTYGGGGYIAAFTINLNTSIDMLTELFQENWLDRQTRAVFFEFTTYCASTNIFIYSSFLVEFPETGGAVTSFSIYPMRLYNHIGIIGLVTLLFEIMFVIYTIVLFGKLCVKFYQERCACFTKLWLVYDTVMFVLASFAIVVYVIRLGFTYLTIEKFKEDKTEFVNFTHIVFWDQLLLSFLASLLFMATIRILEAFGHVKKVQAIAMIFQRCGKDLISFGTAFGYLFVGFCLLGYLLFGSQLKSYMSVYHTLGTLFVTMLGVSKYADINMSHPVLAKIFFILYTLCIIFFVLSIFLSILGESVDSVIKETRLDSQQDIIEYMMDRMKSLIVGGSEATNGRQKSASKRRTRHAIDMGYDNRKAVPYMLSQRIPSRTDRARFPNIKMSD